MSNLPLVSAETQDPVVRPVFERLRGRWGEVLRLYRVLAWSPPLVRAWSSFAWALRVELHAPRRLRELLVIRVASLLGADYEYGHHLQMARSAGVTDSQIADLQEWQVSTVFSDSEKLVLQLADELALSTGATRDTMMGLQRAYPPDIVVELVVTGAFYCGVARIVNSLEIELEENHEQLMPQQDH